MTPIEWTEIARNVSLACAAPFGAYVAWSGLKSWRIEEGSKKSNEIAEALLVLLVQKKDLIFDIRYPAWVSEPVKVDSEGNRIATKEMQDFLGLVRRYDSFFDRLNAIRSDVYGKRLLAAAYWGETITKLLEDIHAHETRLTSCIQAYLRSENPEAHEGRRAAAQRRVSDELLWGGEGDDFEQTYERLLLPVETYLRDKLLGVGP